jgi:tetratricopeptide (TPR) repeat protein
MHEKTTTKILRYFLALGLFCITINLSGQDNCREKLVSANALYEKGDLNGAIEMVLPCTKSDASSEVWQTYKLLAKAYLANNQEEEANKAAVKMLEINPSYEPNPRTDPKDLINLLKKIDVIPKLSLGLSFIYGTNITVPRIQKAFAPSTYDKTYSNKLGSQFGMVAGYNFNRNHSLELDVFYNTKNYELSYNSGGSKFTISETLNYFDFPLLYRYSISTSKRLRFSLKAGAYGSILVNSYNDLNISGTTENKEVLHYSSVKRRNKILYGGVIGAGLKYKVGSGHLSFDARYHRSMTNITDPDSRYDNSTLIYDFLYLDDNILLDYLSFSFGYHLYINYRVNQ